MGREIEKNEGISQRDGRPFFGRSCLRNDMPSLLFFACGKKIQLAVLF